MDSSQIYGGSGESQTDESGWTMYIASSIHGEDGDDDSLASDASSGPSYQGISRAVDDEEEQNNGLKKKKDTKKPILEEKKKKKKKDDKNKQVGLVHSTGADTHTTTTCSSSKTGSKLRNKFWKGRTK